MFCLPRLFPRLAPSLAELMLSGNRRMVGQLPDAAGGLPYLRQITLDDTGMSCIPDNIALGQQQAQLLAEQDGRLPPTAYACPVGSHLPCFLEFADYSVPRSDKSGMACHPVQRKAPSDISAECVPLPPSGEKDLQLEHWDLPPAYYQFYGCNCLDMYVGSWSNNGTLLTCHPTPVGPLPAWAWVLVALGAVMVVLAAALVMLSSRVSRLRSRWIRELEVARKRRQGLPQSGARVSVVVTDIEGYSRETWNGAGLGWGADVRPAISVIPYYLATPLAVPCGPSF